MGFKMKNPSMAKMVKMAGNSRVAAKMKAEEAMKMKKAMKLKEAMKMKEPMKMKKEPMEMGHSPKKFNAKLRKASKEGKLNPEFKAAVDAAPIKMKKESSMKMGHKSPAKKGHKDPEYTTHGNPSKYTTSSGKSVDSANIDEGNLSTVKKDSNGRKFVTVQDDTEKFKAGTKLYIK